MRPAGSSSGGIDLSDIAVRSQSGPVITATLEQAQRNALEAMDTPQLDIGAGAVSDAASVPIAASEDNPITVADTAPPTVAVAKTTMTDRITLEMSEPVTSSSAGPNGFTVNITSGTAPTISSIEGSGTDTLFLMLSADLAHDDTITLSYTPGDVQDKAPVPNKMAPFSGKATSNDIPVPPPPIIITSPPDDHTTNTTPLTVHGTSASNATLTVSGGATNATTMANGTGSWSVPVALSEGHNTLKASDGTSVSEEITVTLDTVAPVITIVGSGTVSLSVGDGYTDKGASCTDERDPNPILTDDVDAVTPNIAGNYTVTYTCIDDANNAAMATRTVTVAPVLLIVQSSEPPTITIHGPQPARIPYASSQAFVDPYGASCHDEEDGSIPVFSNNNLNPFRLGTYRAIYDCTDSDGNMATASRRMIVYDGHAPTIHIIGRESIQVDAGSAYEDAGATCRDSLEGDLPVRVISTVDADTPRTYIVTYKCADSAGNAAKKHRLVDVVTVIQPNGPPVAHAGHDRTVESDDAVTLDGLSSRSHDDGSLAYSWRQISGSSVAISGNATAALGFTAPSGPAVLVFELTVVDGSGNSDADTAQVTVLASSPGAPVADAGPDQYIEYGEVPARYQWWLDGSGSHDPDGDSLTYLWRQVSGQSIGLYDKDRRCASFYPLDSTELGTTVIELTVSDGTFSSTDTVNLIVDYLFMDYDYGDSDSASGLCVP